MATIKVEFEVNVPQWNLDIKSKQAFEAGLDELAKEFGGYYDVWYHSLLEN